MKILHIVNMTFVGGGINTVLPQQIKHENTLDNIQSELLVTAPNPVIPENLDFACYVLSSENLKVLLEEINPDIAVFHSLYKFEYLEISKKLIQNDIPYYIKPHGGFSKVAQEKSYLRKKLANFILFQKFVKRSNGIIYLNKLEQEHSFFKHENVFFMPNGLDIDKYNTHPKPDLPKNLKILFLGRLDFHAKGLGVLIKSISKIKSYLLEKKVEVSIYGFGANRDIKKLVNTLQDLEVKRFVSFNGKVIGEEKQKVLDEHQLFILTSKTEGMPMGVIEALANGLPCILTPGTNMAGIVSQANAGWEVELSEHGISKGIIRAIEEYEINPKFYITNAKCLSENFDWEKVIKEYDDEYKKILKYTISKN